MTLCYHPEFQALLDSGFPAGNLEGTVEELRERAAPLYAQMRDLPMAEGVKTTDLTWESLIYFTMRQSPMRRGYLLHMFPVSCISCMD